MRRRIAVLFALATLATLTFVRLYLAQTAPYLFITAAVFDDALQVGQAQSLIEGNWLGDYSSLTLAKGISFPAFLAVLHWLHIPYGLGLGALMVFASALAARSLRPAIPNPFVRALLFCSLMFCPVGFSTYIGMRIYRNAIVAWGALGVLAGAVGSFLRRSSMRSLVPWIVVETVFLVFFYHMREDSLWILPLVVGANLLALALALTPLAKPSRKTRPSALFTVLFVIAFAFPLVGLGASNVAIAMCNERAYSVAAVNDRTGTQFAVMMDLLHRIDSEDAFAGMSDVFLPRAAVEKAIAASPSLRKIEDEIWRQWEPWIDEDGQIRGDLAQWSLRDAVAEAGHYRDGRETNAFYAQVVRELEEAFSDGTLSLRPGIFLSSQLGPLFMSDFTSSALDSVSTLRHVVASGYCEVIEPSGEGATSLYRNWEYVLRMHVIDEAATMEAAASSSAHAKAGETGDGGGIRGFSGFARPKLHSGRIAGNRECMAVYLHPACAARACGVVYGACGFLATRATFRAAQPALDCVRLFPIGHRQHIHVQLVRRLARYANRGFHPCGLLLRPRRIHAAMDLRLHSDLLVCGYATTPLLEMEGGGEHRSPLLKAGDWRDFVPFAQMIASR